MIAYIPAAPARTELRVLNSRFIATLAPAGDVPAARALIAAVRSEFPDASHHVYAYVIGHGATTTLGMSDDGEPSGTAGRPTLAVLRGSGLGDVVLVTTRYFGGTLLGTGGLVHAYGDAARAVIALAQPVAKIARCRMGILLPYALYAQARRMLQAHSASIDTEEFAADVGLIVTLPTQQCDALQAALTELTAGAVVFEPCLPC